MKVLRTSALLILTLLPAACGSEPDDAGDGTPETPAVDTGAATPPDPVAATPDGPMAGPASDGRWFPRLDAPQPFVGFGAPASEPRFAIACDPAGPRVVFRLSGTSEGDRRVAVHTASGTVEVVAAATGGELPTTEGSLPADAPALDALRGASGRMAVVVEAGDTLRMEVPPALDDVLERCDGGGA